MLCQNSCIYLLCLFQYLFQSFVGDKACSSSLVRKRVVTTIHKQQPTYPKIFSNPCIKTILSKYEMFAGQCTVVRITTDGAFINQIGLFYCTKNFDLNFPTSDTRQFYNQY